MRFLRRASLVSRLRLRPAYCLSLPFNLPAWAPRGLWEASQEPCAPGWELLWRQHGPWFPFLGLRCQERTRCRGKKPCVRVLMPAFGLCGCLPPAVGPELGVCLQKPLYFLGSK